MSIEKPVDEITMEELRGYLNQVAEALPYKMPVQSARVLRFWAKVDKAPGQGPQGECWEWTRARNQRGYGACQEYINGVKTRIASRAAYFFHFEEDPGDLNVCHTCDNPPCCRPNHLFLGTDSDNMLDKVQKGRGKRILSKEQVLEIKRIILEPFSPKLLAAQYGISDKAISNIKTGRTWKWVQI